CTECSDGQFETSGCSDDSDRTCTSCSTCSEGQFEVSACGSDSDTVCGSCDASCESCDGPEANQCTSCPSGSELEGGECAQAQFPDMGPTADMGASGSGGSTSPSSDGCSTTGGQVPPPLWAFALLFVLARAFSRRRSQA
ncbi:MAG: hypothetical protein KC561_08335, partial [Myxococcales bacterium]|nr:hypothetical protein [Myxococcales bacterium]